MPLRTVLAAALVLALAAPVAGAAAPAAPQKPRAAKVGLKRFQDCSGLVRYARRNALRNARSLIVRRVEPMSRGGDDDSGAGGGEREASQPLSAPEDFSGTNVQEAGVDEPDLVKTDGTRLLVVTGDVLHSIDPRAATPALLDSLPLPEGYGHEILLRGDRALVMSVLFGGDVSLTRITEVDVSRPDRLRVINTLDAEGVYLSARLTGATARIVITSSPRALTSVRRVRRAQLGGWTPRAVLTRRATGRKRTSRLVPCRWVRRTRSFSGVDMVSVVTVDMEQGLPAVDTDGLMTDADTVYASTDSLYIASHRWLDPLTFADREPPEGMKTAIHRFDASQSGRTQYRSSGEVSGFLLSQWALSEHAGYLRVASTESPDWWFGDEGDSQSHVTVLGEQENRMVEVGRVSGLGRGERIYAVRFIGDVGYVVTFRETDPLYTVDVSAPTAPRVLGELKILGYSAYLHPVAPDLLLGVGQDATAEGRRRGTQLSLFDVSDLRNPVRLHQRTLGEFSESAVEWDHRAFLYWPATSLTVLPITDWERDFFGAVGFHASRAGITELGRFGHRADPAYLGEIRRTLVLGGRLFTISDAGVMATPLDTLRGGAWLPFPT